jgi:hypothetical protein
MLVLSVQLAVSAVSKGRGEQSGCSSAPTEPGFALWQLVIRPRNLTAFGHYLNPWLVLGS